MPSRISTLPVDVQNEIYKKVYDDSMKALKKFVEDKRWEYKNFAEVDKDSISVFQYLKYEGFRPFNPSYSGAREIGIYIYNCWEPFLETCATNYDDDDQTEFDWDQYWDEHPEEYDEMLARDHPEYWKEILDEMEGNLLFDIFKELTVD